MLQIAVDQKTEVSDRLDFITIKPSATEIHVDSQLDEMLANLSPDLSWGDRQKSARKLGYMGNPAAVAGLLTALPADPFWMVRCAIIQALEKIGDPRAIPTLQRVETGDSFQVVRSHATKAIETLSQERS